MLFRSVSAWREENDGFELGWIIAPGYVGRGYAFEASKALMEWCVRERKAKRITAHCDSENCASARLMEKLGMTRIVEDGTRVNRGSDEARVEWIYAYDVPV